MRLGMSLVLVSDAALFAGCDPNAKPTFGKTWLPKNCRAIIQANIDGWRAKQFSAAEALGSIERNCRAYGYSWGQ
jgi:hypothetical protein